MSGEPDRPLDPRAWLTWALAAALPPLLGRNPWPLAATLLAVLGVWGVWGGTRAGARWQPLLRLALIFSLVSVLFNLLTAHVGDIVLFTLPESWPIVGGALTLNALVYGLLGALAIVTLVLVSVVIGATLDWTLIIRLLPERMTALAVTGSVAWSYLPGATTAFLEIREAQMARGYRPRGLRDAGPLILPLLAGGLERALITAEALEARAFGTPLSPAAGTRPWQIAAIGGGLAAIATGAFCLALGLIPAATMLLLLAALLFLAGLLGGRARGAIPGRTRYREPVWERPEWLMTGVSVVVLAVEIAILAVDPGAFRYEPYPALTAPSINLVLLAAIGLLVTPAAIRP